MRKNTSFISFWILILWPSLIACSNNLDTESTPTPYLTSVPEASVMGDGVEIEGWEYFGPFAFEYMPEPSEAIRDVSKDIMRVRLVKNEDRFDLLWGNLPCSVHPVVIIHANALIEFWPGGAESPFCEAMEAFHKLTIYWQTDIPFEQWEFILHLPPEPDS